MSMDHLHGSSSYKSSYSHDPDCMLVALCVIPVAVLVGFAIGGAAGAFIGYALTFGMYLLYDGF